ncbi:MAG: VWA domain-containing protein [Thermoanaerobaculia bacterium]
MNRIRNLILITAAVAAIAAPILAQKTPPPPTQPSGEVPKLVESIDVRVINIDVVVTDRKGNPITGLKQDDFELLENGVLKPISNFYEVEAPHVAPAAPATTATGAPPAPVAARPAEEIPDNQKRRILFFIDNLSLHPFNRNRVFKEMKEFAKTSMRPGDEAMIATYNRSLKVRVPFTRDVTVIQGTLDIIAGESALGISTRSERADTEGRIRDAQTYDDAVAIARQYSQSIEHDLRQSVSSLNGLLTTLAGVEGKKILVLTSEGFPMQPGREMFYFIDDVGKEKGWSQQSSLLEGMSFDGHSEIESVAKTANANGITVYAIHAAGLDAGNDNSAERSTPTPYTVSQAAQSNTTESMQLMADMTGGLASIRTNNFKAAFNRIASDLDTYYSLGYRAGTERVDRQRSIQVRLKTPNRNYIVRSRQTFVEKSTYAEMSDRVVANALYPSKANDMKILTRIGTPVATDDEDLFRVPVDIQIPMESLTLVPQGEEMYTGGFDVYVVVANKDGDLSDVARKTHQLHVPSVDMARTKGKFYTYSVDLLMEKGLNRISVGVSDEISNTTGFARDQVLAKDLR